MGISGTHEAKALYACILHDFYVSFKVIFTMVYFSEKKK